MASITKYVNQAGAGDYTDLISGVVDILASGVAGSYTNMYLIVDSGYYTGSFMADIPNSGSLYLIGQSGTWFEPDATCFISGIYNTETEAANFVMSDFRVVGSGITDFLFSIYANTKSQFIDIHFLETTNGIFNSGNLNILDTEAIGTGSGDFIVSPTGTITLNNSTIANFIIGLSGDITCSKSNLLDNTIGIYSNNYVNVPETLINGVSGIVMTSGTLNLFKCTIDTSSECLTLSGVHNLNVNRSILSSEATYTVAGSDCSGVINSSCLYSGNWDPGLVGISGVGNFHDDPLFKNPTVFDYRLILRDTIGSPCIEVYDNSNIGSGVTVITDQSHLVFKDLKGTISSQYFRDFVYKQGNTLLFSDYSKEVLYAELTDQYPVSDFELYSRLQFSVSGIPLYAAMDGRYANFPYDWDIKTFSTPEITDEHEYVIPRSVMNVTEAISGYVGNYFDNIIFSEINKTMITVYLYKDLRGVSYDFDLSVPGKPIVWTIEGTNQILNKVSPYSNEILESYPLFVANRETKYIFPSGLIPAGVFQDKYKYILESNPQTEYLTDSDDGGFKWISTSIDKYKDARGIVAYKGNLFITLSDYNAAVDDRNITPTGFAIGKILLYSDNHTFEHYIANYTMAYEPTQLILASGNAYPTDLTIYEDGILYVADYTNSSGLYKYRLAYDYAMIQSSYDQDSLVLLREEYENVEL